MKKYTIGIDLGGTNTKIALVENRCRIVRRKQFQTKAHSGKRQLIDAIASGVTSIISESKLKKSQVKAIGIGVPGLVDSKNGIVYHLTNISGWKDVNLKKLLQQKTGIRTYVDNDVNLMALAESKFGAAAGSKNVFCVTLGTGVGGGIVINNEIYRGNTQSAGEIGHVPISPDGPKCNCGRRGCLEAYVGNAYIAKRVIERIRKGEKTILKGLAGSCLNKITPQLITEAARKGDIFSRQIWSQTAEYLSRGLVFIINVLNPEVIVIGGGMVGAGKFLFDPLRRYLRQNAIRVAAMATKIVAAKLGNDAGVIGAAEFARMSNEK